MAWLYVFIGGLFEIGWALGLKYSQGFTVLVPSVLTVITIAISFWLFAKSMRLLPIGTAYAVFTGIGSAGTVVVGMLFLGESTEWSRIFFVLLLLGGIVGLKLTETDDGNGQQKAAAKLE